VTGQWRRLTGGFGHRGLGCSAGRTARISRARRAAALHCFKKVGNHEADELNREHGVMLQELRIALPGMQMLFAFLLTIPFNSGFERANELQRDVYAIDLICTTLSSVFLIAPAVYHRLHWRRDVDDKNRMLHVINRLAIVGGVFLSFSIVASVFLVMDYLFGTRAATIVGGCVAATCFVVWYGLPLLRRMREGD
jgi:hypothetical protein